MGPRKAMVFGLKLARILSLTCLVGIVARAEESTRYVLAPTVFLTDPDPDSRRPDLQALAKEFRQEFERRIPGHRPLSEKEMLDPTEPALLVVPRITAMRLDVLIENA